MTLDYASLLAGMILGIGFTLAMLASMWPTDTPEEAVAAAEDEAKWRRYLEGKT